MSRSPGASAMIDIRTAAIHQDITYAANPCAPGADKIARNPLFRFYGASVLDIEGPMGRRRRYDTQADWVACIAAATIAGTILGIIHSFGIMLPYIAGTYDIGQIEAIIIGAMTYAIVILFGPISCFFIKLAGERLVCIFGLLLFFLGLLLDAFQIQRSAFFLTHIIFMGIGGSLAYTAAMSSVINHFRKSLPLALTVLSISSPIGTAIYYTLSIFLIKLFPREASYKWMHLMLAVIVLVLTSATHFLPSRIPRRTLYRNDKPRSQRVKECIENNSEPPRSRYRPDPCAPDSDVEGNEDDPKSCMCVIVIDVSVWTDTSFLLWAVISLCALLTFYVPYLFLVRYAKEVLTSEEAENFLYLILWFCLASVVARVGTLVSNDMTFNYNRLLFQGCLIGSGVLYLFVVNARTFGWVTVWALVVGALEGVLSTVIPRVTLQTIPRKWMASSWSYIIFLHGLGILLGPIIVITSWVGTGGHYGVGFVVIGLAQIIAALLAFILPNEEATEDRPRNELRGKSFLPPLKPDSYYFGPNSYSKRLEEYKSVYANGSKFSSGCTEKYEWLKDYGLYSGGGCGGCYPSTTGSTTYSTNCPICSKIGCVPGCCDCGPGTPNCYDLVNEAYRTMEMNGNSGYGYVASVSRFQTAGLVDPCLSMPAIGPSISKNALTSTSAPRQQPNEPQPGTSSDGTVKRVNFEIRHTTTTTPSTSGIATTSSDKSRSVSPKPLNTVKPMESQVVIKK